jgi:hypothetical protein
VQNENAFSPLPGELPLPGKESGDQYQHHDRCRSQKSFFPPLSKKIKRHAGNEQGHRNLN